MNGDFIDFNSNAVVLEWEELSPNDETLKNLFIQKNKNIKNNNKNNNKENKQKKTKKSK